jgi:acetyltransferase-like isoleucine patch superfamily enzyme
VRPLEPGSAVPRRVGRKLGLLVIALLPGSLKRLLYRAFFGYRIEPGSRVGLAYLDCARLTIGAGTSIGHGVAFLRCGEVSIGRHVRIGPLNLFRGGRSIQLDDYAEVLRLNVINSIPETDRAKPDASFHLGFGSIITAEHRIDFTDGVRIGRCSIFGGRNSSIWTHNRRTGLPVMIGEFCYVGSEIRMAPGAKVPDCCVVALGSVVTSEIAEPFSLIGGVPAKRLRGLDARDDELIFGKTRLDIPDDLYPPHPDGPAASRRSATTNEGRLP